MYEYGFVADKFRVLGLSRTFDSFLPELEIVEGGTSDWCTPTIRLENLFRIWSKEEYLEQMILPNLQRLYTAVEPNLTNRVSVPSSFSYNPVTYFYYSYDESGKLPIFYGISINEIVLGTIFKVV